jgi:hypothetical protein
MADPLSPPGVVVYKVGRLIRSLADFAKMVELFEALVSVTQRFNTASMGRLTLKVLLSFGGAWACGQSRRGPRSSRL